MKLYACKVRLQGEVKDEVQKINVTAAEIRVMQNIHGDDAVVDIRMTGEVDRSETDERDRLAKLYDVKVVEQMFGIKIASVVDEIDLDTPPENAEPEQAPKHGFQKPTQELPTATRTTSLDDDVEKLTG